MPAPVLRHHWVLVGDASVVAARELEVPRDAPIVTLQGPRYRGEARLPERCTEPVTLQARPLPAQIDVHDLPPRAVVSCLHCPGVDPDANYLPKHLPPVVMRGWALRITLRVRAPGFDVADHAVVLHPGENDVAIPMRLRRQR